MPDGREDSKLTPDELDALLGRVEQRIADERGPLAAFRRSQLNVRVAAIAVTGLSIVLVALLVMPRSDWTFGTGAPWAQIDLASWMFLVGSVLCLVVGATLAGWPLSRRAPTTAQIELVGASVGALALGMGLLIGHGESPSELLPILRCAALGAVSGVPAALVALAARRDAAGSTVGAVAVGAAVALLTQTVTCPVETLTHLVVGHALPLGLAGFVSVLLYLRPTRA